MTNRCSLFRLYKGITKDYHQCIIMLDWTTQKIIFVRQFLHSLPFRIKDIEFIPGSVRKFVTTGIQHICFWQLSGKNLQYQVGELTIPKTYSNVGGGNFVSSDKNQAKFGMSLVTDEYQ